MQSRYKGKRIGNQSVNIVKTIALGLFRKTFQNPTVDRRFQRENYQLENNVPENESVLPRIIVYEIKQEIKNYLCGWIDDYQRYQLIFVS